MHKWPCPSVMKSMGTEPPGRQLHTYCQCVLGRTGLWPPLQWPVEMSRVCSEQQLLFNFGGETGLLSSECGSFIKVSNME